jgi:hypothetical protein
MVRSKSRTSILAELSQVGSRVSIGLLDHHIDVGLAQAMLVPMEDAGEELGAA